MIASDRFKFEIEPEVEPVFAISFEEIDGQDEDEVWHGNQKRITQELQNYLLENQFSNDKSNALFSLFYQGKVDEVTFFNDLEILLNQQAIYTYNSDTRFELYESIQFDLKNPNFLECLSEAS